MLATMEVLVGMWLGIDLRLRAVVGSYLLSLMHEATRHTQMNAAQLSGLHRSQFSRLLSEHGILAQESLEAIGKAKAKLASAKRKLLLCGAPWTVALIIDATLHQRSSLHCHNAQRFNHGQGFVIGHQWTNIVLLIGGQAHVIALPPIPFLTRRRCREVGRAYKTEHERILAYLQALDLSEYLGDFDPSEIVVLTDSGYDNKVLEKFYLSQGWDFISALKCKRSVRSQTSDQGMSVTELFRKTRKQSPWETVHAIVHDGQKKRRRKFRARQIVGFLKGLKKPLTLICSEKSKGRGRMFLACSNDKVSTSVIVRAYRLRWSVELFHRAVKNNFGLQHAGVENFASLVSHVHWVYCSYLLLPEVLDHIDRSKTSIPADQRRLSQLCAADPFHSILELSHAPNALANIRAFCQERTSMLRAA